MLLELNEPNVLELEWFKQLSTKSLLAIEVHLVCMHSNELLAPKFMNDSK